MAVPGALLVDLPWFVDFGMPFKDGRCSSWLGDSIGDTKGDSVVAMVRSGWRLTEFNSISRSGNVIAAVRVAGVCCSEKRCRTVLLDSEDVLPLSPAVVDRW
ncbi:hypothetical protein ACLOJK_004121 [Asimina triloba]